MALSGINAMLLLASTLFYFAYGQIQEHEFGIAAAIEFVSCVENGQPIPTNYRCDGIEDCPSGTDEQECGSSSSIDLDCLITEFECSPGECVNLAFICDGIDHCDNGRDEANCPDKSECFNYEFTCANNHNCIDETLHCDGFNDCGDNSDEKNCGCDPDTTVQCQNSNQCIPKNWQCDGENDCPGGTDEAGCPNIPSTCSVGAFTCESGECMLASVVCDGTTDCPDESDEDSSLCYVASCEEDEYACPTRCIRSSYVCDNVYDCIDGSDELNCVTSVCKSHQYQCISGRCVNANKKCDGVENCDDGSDEFFCPPVEVVCEEDEFPCHDGQQCITDMSHCDGIVQCDDGSDELHCPNPIQPGVDECVVANGGCEDLCHDSYNSYYCMCSGQGYHINTTNGQSCVDIDECDGAHKCSHYCINTDGGYNCSCAPGYDLVNGRDCIAQDGAHDIFFTNYYDIQKFELNRGSSGTPEVVIDGLRNVAGIDYHYELNYLFYADLSRSAIMRSSINGSDAVPIVTRIGRPEDIAVDWINNLIYWTDSKLNRVEVATLDGRKRSVLRKTRNTPQDIVVDPINRNLYWTEKDTKYNNNKDDKIKTAALDGSGYTNFISGNIYWVGSLALDLPSQTIYWTDPQARTIQSSSLSDARSSRSVTRNVTTPLTIEVFENEVYWIDQEKGAIYSVNKITGKDFNVVLDSIFKPVDLTIVHGPKQVKGSSSNPCDTNNGGCEYLCIPTATSHSCLCPLSFELLNDGITCSEPDAFILYSATDSLWVVPLEAQTTVDVLLLLDTSYSNIIDMDWDRDHRIFWIDASLGSISTATPFAHGSTNQTILVDTDISQPTGVAVDWIAGKLYWIDTGLRRIYASNLDGSHHVLVVQEAVGSLSNLVLHPKLGLMFWSVYDITRPCIKQAHLDGTNVQELSFGRHNDVGSPNYLALDYTNDRLYWVDVSDTSIKSAFIDGTDFEIVSEASELSGTKGIAIYGNHIYWTDRTGFKIRKIDTNTHRADLVINNRESLQGLTIYHTQREYLEEGAHPCTENNGGCEWLCLSKPNLAAVCKCPVGLKLLEDGKTCKEHPDEYIIIASSSKLSMVSLDINSDTEIAIPISPAPNDALSVDVDLEENYVYWVDGGTNSICRVHYLGGQKEVVIAGLVRPTALAVDWIGRNLYWADSGTRRIEVSHLDGSDRLVLVQGSIASEVTSIALDLKSHNMYWSSAGSSPRVVKATMDGSNERAIIYSPEVSHPVSLTIDSIYTISNTLFITDSDKNRILRYQQQTDSHLSDFLYTSTEDPIGLATTIDHLYYVDRASETLLRATKSGSGSNRGCEQVLTHLKDVRDIAIAKRQDWLNRGDLRYPCGKDSVCGSLCLPNQEVDFYSCNCPTGIMLNNDGTSCPSVPSLYLLFSTGSSLRRVSQDDQVFYDVPVVLDLDDITYIDYHLTSTTSGYLYWLDSCRGAIMRSTIYGTDVEPFMEGLGQLSGLSIEWTSGSIYFISGNDILVASPDGQYRKVLASRIQPKELVVHPFLGLMFWTELGSSNRRQIVRASLENPKFPSILEYYNVEEPVQLAMDIEGEWLYWTDRQKGTIERIKLYGGYRSTITNVHRPFGLALYGNVMFWGEESSQDVVRAYRASPPNRKITMYSNDGAGAPRGLTVVSTDRNGEVNGNLSASSCAYENGGCLHICLPYTATIRKCACPTNFYGYCDEYVGRAPVPPPRDITPSVTQTRASSSHHRKSYHTKPRTKTVAPELTETPIDEGERQYNTDTGNSSTSTLDYAMFSVLAMIILVIFSVVIIIVVIAFLKFMSKKTETPVVVHNELFKKDSTKDMTAKALGYMLPSPAEGLPRAQLNNTSDINKSRRKVAQSTNRLSLTKVPNTDQQVFEKPDDFNGPEEFVVTPIQSRRQQSVTTPPTSPKPNTSSDAAKPPLPEKPRKVPSLLPMPQTPAKLALKTLDTAEPTVSTVPTIKTVKFNVEEPPPVPPRPSGSHAGPPLSPPPFSALSLSNPLFDKPLSSSYCSDSDVATDYSCDDIFTDTLNSSTDMASEADNDEEQQNEQQDDEQQ